MLDKEISNLKSDKIKSLIFERIGIVFDNKDTVSIGYQYPTNTNSISNSNTNIDSNIVSIEEINNYFDKIYSIYPRKVSKVQAKTTFEHKLRGLDKEEAHKLAVKIYRLLEKQIAVWKNENGGEGRKIEHIPYPSSWLSANVEDSSKYSRRRK
jgi:hypothetical protein